MSVRQKTVNGVKWWIADYTDKSSGRRHQVRFKRQGDAEAHEQASKVAIRAGQHVSVDPNRTIDDAADEWIARVEANGMRGSGKLEGATIRQYRQHVKLHILPHIGGKLSKLTMKDVETFRNRLLGLDTSGTPKLDENGNQAKPPMSRAMARKVMTSFKSMLKAAKVGHLAADVTIGVSKRERRKLEIGRDIPTPEEIRRLINAAKDSAKLHALLLTAALCGLRASELRGVRWVDIDLKSGELHVRQRAERKNEIGPPKSEHGTRTIPFGTELRTALTVWKLQCPKGDLDLVFPTRTGAVEYHKNMMRSLRPVMKAAGLANKNGKPKYAKPLHSLRHFFASWCINPIERGGRQLTPKVVQTLMGHSSIAITLDLYSHLFPSGSDRSELEASSRALLGA
jgi:integrase